MFIYRRVVIVIPKVPILEAFGEMSIRKNSWMIQWDTPWGYRHQAIDLNLMEIIREARNSK